MKLFGVRSYWQAHDDSDGQFDYGIFSTFGLAMEAIAGALDEERESLSKKELASRQIEYGEREIVVTDGLYRNRTFHIREYELDKIRDWNSDD